METRLICFLFLVVTLFSGAGFAAELSDADLLKLATQKEDKPRAGKRVLGTHDGVSVIQEYAGTTRVIAYDVKKEDCAKVGGVMRRVMSSSGASAQMHQFCQPAVLVGGRSEESSRSQQD